MFGAVIIDNRPIDTDWLIQFKSFLPIDWEIVCFKNHSVKTLNDYNTLMTSRTLWEAIPFEKVLIFQQDAKLLRKWDSDFEQFDYVGSPWKFQDHGGNGGLSWRSKEHMLKVIEKYPYNVSAYGYEDVYFSNHIQSVGGKLAPRTVCSKFAVESVFTLGAMGVHAIEKYLTPNEVKLIYSQYK